MYIYESVGGMETVAWTDVVQGGALLMGLSFLLVSKVPINRGDTLLLFASIFLARTSWKLQMRDWVKEIVENFANAFVNFMGCPKVLL